MFTKLFFTPIGTISAFVNITRWQGRVWSTITTYIELAKDPKSSEMDPKKLTKIENALFQDRNHLIHEVNVYLNIFKFILSLESFLRTFLRNPEVLPFQIT